MNIKHFIRVTAAALAVAFAAPAFAGGITVAEKGDSKLKIESLFYLNTYSHKTSNQAGTTGESLGLNVERAYFTAKYHFNDDWMMRFTTDLGHEGTLGKQQNIYLKYAYVEGKLVGDAAVLRLGQSHTPWIDYEQHLWGHRYVAKVATDFFKYDDSSDLGIGLKGKLADGMVGYWITATNGSGYGKGVASKGIDFNSRIGVYPIDGLTLDLQYRNGYRGTKTFGALPTAITKSTLFQFMATYSIGKDFRVGANYITNKKDTNGAIPKDNGYSVWGTAKFAGQFGAFARYDKMDNKNAAGAKTGKDSRITGGVEYTPLKGVTFALAFENRKTDNLAVPGNFTKDNKAGLYTQIKL